MAGGARTAAMRSPDGPAMHGVRGGTVPVGRKPVPAGRGGRHQAPTEAGDERRAAAATSEAITGLSGWASGCHCTASA